MVKLEMPKLRKCRICSHIYSVKAHNNHCPVCGTVAINLANVTVKDATPVPIGKAKFYGRGK